MRAELERCQFFLNIKLRIANKQFTITMAKRLFSSLFTVKDNICDNSTMFLCKLITQCIEKEKKCDGKYDCLDQTDEINCHSTPCNETDFFCDNGVCINSSKVCNDRNDCGDWSDELLCSE